MQFNNGNVVIRQRNSPRHVTQHKLFKFISHSDIGKSGTRWGFFSNYLLVVRNERTIMRNENGEMKMFIFLFALCVFDIYSSCKLQKILSVIFRTKNFVI